jgi:hypothetical protein
MRKSWIFVPLGVIALSACAQQGGEGEQAAAEAAAEAPIADAASSADTEAASSGSALPALDKLPTSLPQLAFVYDYRWRMPAEGIGGLQRRHAALCEQQGPAVCQITGMTRTGEQDDIAGELHMAVATRQARAFGALLEDEAIDAGAEQVSAEIASEELSKQIVDTEARIAARTELRDRLREVLRTRKGKIEELIEAESGVAAVNEEIDAARSWLKEMRGRVAYSQVTVRYETGTPVTGDFLGPVSGALGSLGTIFGYLVALLILIGSVGLPAAGVWWGARALGRRMTPAAVDRS